MRLPMLLFLLCVSCMCQGQILIAPDISRPAMIQGLDTMSVNLPNFHGLVDTEMLIAVKKRWLLGNFGDILGLNGIKEPSWNLETNNFYASGQSASYFGEGWCSNTRLEHRLEIAGLPMVMSGDLILQNNRVNRRLSTLGVEFDQDALFNKYRAKIGQRAVQESFDDLSKEQKQSLKEYFSIEAAREVLLSDAYQSRKTALTHHIDSLGNTLQAESSSTLLDSLKGVRTDIQRTEYKFDSLYNTILPKWDETQQTVKEWRGKVLKQQQILEEEIQDGELYKNLHKYVEKRNQKPFLLNFSRLKLGSFQLRSSVFDVSSVPLNGISMEVRRGGYYAASSYGKEGRQRRQFPDYVRNVRLAGEGRTILQVKAGIGMPEKSHFHLALSTIRAGGSLGDSVISAFPKRNVLISMDSRYLIADQFFVEMTGSVSGADFTGNLSTKSLLGSLYDESVHSGNNMAGLFRFGWRNKKGQSEYTVGYQAVGSDFYTLGNLFLINNRNAVRLEGKQQFLHTRGLLKITYIKGTTSGTTEVVSGVQQNQFSGEFSYRLTKNGSRAWASYSPNFYLQNASGSSPSVYQLNLSTIGVQWMFPQSKRGQWTSIFQATNYSDQTQYGDTSIVTGLWYGMYSQTYSSERYLVTALANIGLDKGDFRVARDVNIDVNQSFMLKKIQIIQGIQVVKRYYGSGFLVGGSGGLQFNIRKRIRAGFSGTYLVGVSNGERNQFYVNSSAGWQF